MSTPRGAGIVLSSAVLAGACASVIGADFGDYRVGKNAGDAASNGGASESGGQSANGGASGNGGQSANGGRTNGGSPGTGGVLTGSGGIPVCVPRKCASVGDACGTLSDGCTSTIDCACTTGTCIGGTCCVAAAACASGQCGTVSDGCQGTLECPACANACANTTKDGSETDVDCGGPACPACALGAACALPRDCLSGSCRGGVCSTPTSCTPTADPTEVCDGVDNDCDGTADNPGACPVNCVGAAYGSVAYMLCKTTRTWVDAQKDCVAAGMNLAVLDSSGATDWAKQLLSANGLSQAWMGAEDRGGEGSWHWLGGTRFWVGGTTGIADPGRYAGWATGEPNDSPTTGGEDCGQLRTTGWNDYGCSNTGAYLCEHVSVASGCFDGLLDGSETDVDCGGGSCGACPPTSACSANTDCDSQACASSVCVDQCKDTVKDGAETDVDCGGACAKCATGKACGVNGDCASGTCTSGACAGCVASACPACTILTPTKCCKTDGTCGCSLLGTTVCN